MSWRPSSAMWLDRATSSGSTRAYGGKTTTQERVGGKGEQARDTLKHITKTAVSIGTRGQGGWAASHIAELGRQLIGVGIVRGIYEQFSIGYGKRCDEFLRPTRAPLSSQPGPPLTTPLLASALARPRE